MAAPLPAPVIIAYLVFASVTFAMYHFVAERQYSSVITMSAIVQCFGATLLCIQVLSSKSAAGISASSLKLDALAIGFRLSSTTWLNGYLPVDRSGVAPLLANRANWRPGGCDDVPLYRSHGA